MLDELQEDHFAILLHLGMSPRPQQAEILVGDHAKWGGADGGCSLPDEVWIKLVLPVVEELVDDIRFRNQVGLLWKEVTMLLE